MRRLFLIAIVGLALAACASAEPARRYSGTWDWHFETSSFAADAGEGPYWLHAEGQAWEDLNAPFRAAGLGPWGQLRVVIQGELSQPGRYGHLGAYSRQLRVTRVISAELLAASPRR
jgi:hypothetical protein